MPITREEWRTIAKELDLTGRIREVSWYMAKGYTHDEIAREIGISPHTVKTYGERAYERTDTRNSQELLIKIFSQWRSSYGPNRRSKR